MSEIAKAYSKGELCGWLEKRQPGIAREQFNLLSSSFNEFRVRGQTVPTAGRKSFLHRVVRGVLGRDTPNYPQQIGDCVPFGAKNGTEYLTCAQILSRAAAIFGEDRGAIAAYVAEARIKFRPVFVPYYYGTGRVYVGRGRLGNQDGSLGSWMAQAVMKYGTVFSDEPGLPAYSGSVSKAWGDPNPAPDLDKWKDYGANYLVRSAAQIRTWDDLCAALANNYPCPTASDIGYDMEPGRDGFHRQTDTWAHQMAFIGVDETYKNGDEPYALILNNWGDVHGHLRDFEDSSEDLPLGVLRVRRRDAEKHLRAGETFAYSQFQGFPEQKLDRALFKLI